jgi:hypothetical protein
VGDWQNIAVVGKPVAYGIGFLVLVLVAFAGGVVRTIVTVAHEGGHMLAGLFFGRAITEFELTDGDEYTGGGGTLTKPATGFGDVFILFVGYATPPLAGLGGAYVVAEGNAWGVLVIGAVLLLAVLLVPKINPLALAVTGLLLGGILWALIAGGPGVQAELAVGLVWLMLIGGLRSVLIRTYGSDDARRLVVVLAISPVFG